MRGSEVQVLASLFSGLLLFNVVVAHPLLVKRSLHPRVSYQSSHQSYRQSQSYGDETFGSHPSESGVREKRVIKEVVVGVGSGLKGTSVAGLKALGSASAGTVGALGSASAGTVIGAGKASAGVLGAVGSAGLGALGAASGLGVRAVGAASGVGVKAIGSASGLGLSGAKALGKVGLSSSKVVGTTGAKVAAKTGFAVAKAALTVGIAKFILSLVFGKINQLIDLRGKLFGVSNPKSNNILSVSLPSSAFAPAHQQQDTTNDDKQEEEDLPEIDPDKVSIQVPDAFFSKGFNVINKASPVIGDVIQNTAERLARFIKQLKPVFRTSLLGSNPVHDEETTMYSFGDDDDTSGASASASAAASARKRSLRANYQNSVVRRQ